MQWAQKQKGFTIVELLIVIVVIAILAAVTIVAFNGVQNRAKASAAQSAAQQVLKKVMSFAVENAEQYPATLAEAGIADEGTTSYQYTVDNSATPATFCVTVTVSDVSYFVSRAQTSPQAGGCPGHGQNGAVAVTNLTVNPSFEFTTSPVEVLRNRIGNPETVSGGTTYSSSSGSSSYVSGYHRNTSSGTGTAYSFPYPPSAEATAGRFTVAPGQRFAFRIEVRNPNATQAYYKLGAGWYDSAGAGVSGYIEGPTESLAPGAVSTFEFSGAVPSTTGLTGMLPILYYSDSNGVRGSAPVGWMIDTTDCALYTGTTVPVSLLPFFSGASAASGDFSHSWVGTVNQSASIMTGVGIGTYYTPPSVAKGVRSTEWSASGSASLRQIPVYQTRGSAYTEVAASSHPRGLVAGQTYTMLAVCRLAETQGFTLATATRALTITGTTDGAYNASAMAPDEVGEHLVRLTFTIPPSGPWYLRLYNGGTRGDPDIWWDNLMIVEGEYDGGYGDGNSPNWIWNGTIGGATSTGPTPN